MPVEQVVQLGRTTLETTLRVGAPILIVATVVSLVISIVQVLTSLQDATVSTVPRLVAAGIATVLLMPWMLRQLAAFTISVFSNLRMYAN